MASLDRRQLLAGIGAAAVIGWLPETALAAPGGFVMWRDPGCGCCLEWAKRIEAAFGKKLPVVNSTNMGAVKQAQGVPVDLQSCHTALIQGIVVEGHVPPADIKRLIAARHRTVKGLAVPGMPAGSPGMDVGHNHRQPYKVFAFGPGARPFVFASHA
jgi:hypothetical protein